MVRSLALRCVSLFPLERERAPRAFLFFLINSLISGVASLDAPQRNDRIFW